MKLEEIYRIAVKKGIAEDPRKKEKLKKIKNPFADTMILYGDKKKDIRTVMVGIDIGGEELLTAYILNEKGAGIDLVMAHHPSGMGLINLYQVMHVQTDILEHLGLRPDIARALMKDRIEEVSRGLMPRNAERSVDIARLLNIPFMNIHTPADNCVARFINKTIEKKKPKRVRDVLRIIKKIPEYQDAATKGAGTCLIAGKEKNAVGKIFVDMTGGTEGSKNIFARLSQAGVNTIVAMHLSEQHFKAAKAEFMNVIIAGHIASDNLGVNLILDELEKKEKLNVIPCSGFVRVKR